MRIAVVDKEKCRPERCNHECKLFCPPERNDVEVITIEKKAKINEQTCIGCGICVKKCPFDAIIIINLTHEAGKLVHQYGENGFRLFNLPVIKESKIVGLLGRNGTGKSTALNILSGITKPNLGKVKEEISWNEIIENFRGSEIQQYLERIKEKRIKVSYKIQRVELISKTYGERKVRDLLDGVEKEIIEEMGLKVLMDRKVSTLSGGELQKIAIAKALSKDADFYFIDEPTSFLDIKNRIDVAKTIKLKLKDKSTLVVEHDLIILDYLSDFVHIIHGFPGAYGVVSNIYHTRRGINSYIEGYIKEENIRFRDYSLEFNYIKESKRLKEKLLYVPKMKKTYDSGFFLEIEDFYLYRGEIIGILGRNGLGKTTFIKLLAGIEKDDENVCDFDLKIGYKPQYISLDYEGSVDNFINENIKLNDDIKNHLMKPLEIERFIHKEVSSLSGGELQRLAILYSLSMPADLYLLDEPSAYLDVEERIILGKILRRYAEQLNTSLFVVDHDLLFLSSVSDRIMVFDGIPAKEGYAKQPVDFREGINYFLKTVDITMRVDEETKRPRINKEESKKHIEMKSKGIYFEF